MLLAGAAYVIHAGKTLIAVKDSRIEKRQLGTYMYGVSRHFKRLFAASKAVQLCTGYHSIVSKKPFPPQNPNNSRTAHNEAPERSRACLATYAVLPYCHYPSSIHSNLMTRHAVVPSLANNRCDSTRHDASFRCAFGHLAYHQASLMGSITVTASHGRASSLLGHLSNSLRV